MYNRCRCTIVQYSVLVYNNIHSPYLNWKWNTGNGNVNGQFTDKLN